MKSIGIEPEAHGEKTEYYHLNFGMTTHYIICY